MTTTTSQSQSQSQSKCRPEQQIAKIPFHHLPLRPSTLTLLTRKGFTYTTDLEICKKYGGLSNVSFELDLSLSDALSIVNEVDRAVLHSIPGTSATDTTMVGAVTTTADVHNESASSSSLIGNNYRFQSQTAASLLQSLHNPATTNNTAVPFTTIRPIISFVKAIDNLLGGGFHPNELIEIVGVPGVGKTQLCMQLSVDALLPRDFGGMNMNSSSRPNNTNNCSNGVNNTSSYSCSVIYIDTEGSFNVERCWDMAVALVNHVHHSAQKSQQQQQQQQQHFKTVPEWFTPEYILDSIHLFRVYDETSQSCTIASLPDFIEELRDKKGQCVKLIIIDSIAFHYRCSSSDYKTRTKSLTSTASFLADLASTYNLSVVVTNHITTKFQSAGSSCDKTTATTTTDHFGDTNKSKLVPALGESWAHCTTTRLLLLFDSGDNNYNHSIENEQNQIVPETRRICKLVKSPYKAPGVAYFSITQVGVRDYRLG